jgi:hypothetical protein
LIIEATDVVVDAVPATRLLERLFRILRPDPSKLEPTTYSGPAEALTLLHRISGLTMDELAFRFGISTPQLQKAKSGSYGVKLRMDQIAIARQIALDLNLRRMADFFKMLHIHTAKKAARGRTQYPGPWWTEEATRGRD